MSRLVSGVPVHWPAPARRPAPIETATESFAAPAREPRSPVRFVISERVVVHHDLLSDAIDAMVRQAQHAGVSQTH